MNKQLFIQEMQSVISNLKTIDELELIIDDLIYQLKQFEAKSDDSEFSNFDFEGLIDEVLSCEDAPPLGEKLILDLSVLYCATILINNGVIIYGYCRPMEAFTQQHLERIAKIVGSQITYDLTKFIVNDEYLKNCLCCPI